MRLTTADYAFARHIVHPVDTNVGTIRNMWLVMKHVQPVQTVTYVSRFANESNFCFRRLRNIRISLLRYARVLQTDVYLSRISAVRGKTI